MNLRECTIKDHGCQIITHLCAFKNCNIPTRWICYQCKDEKVHDHETFTENYLVDLRNSKQYLSDQIQPILDYNLQQQENIHKFKKNLKALHEQIQTLEKQFQQQESKITESLSFRSKLNKGIIYLTPEEINKLLNLDEFVEKGPQEKQSQIFSTVINNTQDLLKSSQEYLQKQEVEHEKIKQTVISFLQSGKQQQEDKLDYELQFEYERQNIYCSQISPNGRYLAVSNSCLIEVVDLDQQNNTKIGKDNKYIKMKNIITTLQFSFNSEFLFAGDYKGIIYCLDLKQRINEIYQKQIHKGSIQKIVAINNNQVITCSQDRSITISSIDQQTEQTISNAHENSISGLEFDHKNNVIVSSSSDNLIKFFCCKCSEKCREACNMYQYMMMKQEYQNVKQIQLLYKNKLLATDGKQVNIWEIQYDKLQLISLQSFQMPFGSVYSIDNKFFYIDKDSLCVYENDLNNKTFEIKHQIENDHRLIQPRLYNQVKYVIVQSSVKINIFQRKKQQN